MEDSLPFKVAPAAVVAPFMLDWRTGWPLWIVLSVSVILCIIGCFADIRWLIVGLIVGLAVLPSVAFFFVFGHASRPDVVANLLPHILERTPDGFLLRIFCRGGEGESGEEEAEWIESGRMTLRDCDIVSSRTTFEYEVICYRNSPLKILYVPRYRNENIKRHQP